MCNCRPADQVKFNQQYRRAKVFRLLTLIFLSLIIAFRFVNVGSWAGVLSIMIVAFAHFLMYILEHWVMPEDSIERVWVPKQRLRLRRHKSMQDGEEVEVDIAHDDRNRFDLERVVEIVL